MPPSSNAYQTVPSGNIFIDETENHGAAYEGEHHELGPLSGFLNETGLVKVHSMDIQNDPRFYQDNVINYRLAAIGGLSIVSGLLVQNSMDHIFEMNKDMTWNPTDLDGFLQFVSFFLICMVLFMNMLATYIGVAQPYHTIRLLTAGPTGFEIAASYYLNKNIVAYRHLAIKSMLLSLPVFIVSSGLRLVVKFDREYYYDSDKHEKVPLQARIQAAMFCGMFLAMAAMLFYVHWKHFAVFRDRYASLSTPSAMKAHIQTMTMPGTITAPRRSWMGGLLDV